MIYCLDTDVLSSLGRSQPPLSLIRRLGSLAPGDACTTSITLGEIRYGLMRKGDAALADRMERALSAAGPVLAFDELAARRYGDLRAELEARGQRLDEPDLRIASIVLARDLTLVTGNVKHFARIPELRIENWLAR